MNPARKLQYVPDPNKFDMRTHVWDSQGNLVNKAPYRCYIMEGRQYFERPVNSGNLWFENNQPAGRVELTFGTNGKISSKRFDFEAAHKEYTAPLTGADALHYELEQAKEKNASLEAEIAQIKKEQDLRQSAEVKIEKEKVEVRKEVSAAPSLSKR